MKKKMLMVFLTILVIMSACKMETDGAAHLQVLNSSRFRVHYLVDDGLTVSDTWVEAGQSHSVLLELGEYRVKVELYEGSQAVAGRLYTLSLTAVGRVHQITVDDGWVSGGGQ